MKGFSSGSDGKESACNAEDLGSIPGLGRSLKESMATHSSILAWRIPWTEDPGKLQSRGLQRINTTEHMQMCMLLLLSHFSPVRLCVTP